MTWSIPLPERRTKPTENIANEDRLYNQILNKALACFEALSVEESTKDIGVTIEFNVDKTWMHQNNIVITKSAKSEHVNFSSFGDYRSYRLTYGGLMMKIWRSRRYGGGSTVKKITYANMSDEVISQKVLEVLEDSVAHLNSEIATANKDAKVQEYQYKTLGDLPDNVIVNQYYQGTQSAAITFRGLSDRQVQTLLDTFKAIKQDSHSDGHYDLLSDL